MSTEQTRQVAASKTVPGSLLIVELKKGRARPAHILKLIIERYGCEANDIWLAPIGNNALRGQKIEQLAPALVH